MKHFADEGKKTDRQTFEVEEKNERTPPFLSFFLSFLSFFLSFFSFSLSFSLFFLREKEKKRFSSDFIAAVVVATADGTLII